MTTIDFSRHTQDDEVVPQAIIDLEKAEVDALFRLTEQQEEAVKHNGSPLLILAGAGTGKTRCLTARMSYRIAKNYITPANILAITFTRKAAKEMKKRLEGIIGPTARALDIGTFHSICSNVLRQNVEMSHLKPGFTTLTQEDQERIIREIHQAHVATEVCIDLEDNDVPEGVIEKIKEIVESNRTKAAITAIHKFIVDHLLDENKVATSQNRLKTINSRTIPKNLEEPTLQKFVEIIEEEAKVTLDIKPDYLKTVINEINFMESFEYDSDEILKEIENFKQLRALSPSLEMEPEPENYVKEYIQRLEATNSADYTDLIAEVCRMFRDKPSVLYYYKQLWTSIYIDEYQDTDDLQEYFISLLADPDDETADLTVVGDDDQSVYSWRNAKIENILTFNLRRQNSKLVRLEENFRSNQGILDRANNLISHNLERLGKKLYSANKTQNTVFEQSGSTAYHHESDERAAIIKRIKYLRDRGVPLSEIAIISRTAMVINPFQNDLIMNNIPFTFTAGRKFTETEKIKTIIAYMRLMRNETDDAAFQAAFTARPRGFGEKPLEKAIRQAQIKGLTARQMLEMMIISGELTAKANVQISEFFDTINRMKSIMDTIIDDGVLLKLKDSSTQDYENLHQQMTEKTKNLIELIQEDMKITDEIKKLEEKAQNTSNKKEADKHTKDAKQIMDNIEQLARIIVEMQDIDGFLDSITLTSTDDQEVDGVWVGTIHAAKGLEFDYVFLPGWEQEIFPSPRSEDSEGGKDEERRLAYVALTRPRKECYISSVRMPRFYLADKMKEAGNLQHTPSEFYKDMAHERDASN